MNPSRVISRRPHVTRADRHAIELPALLTWKDHRGATRFASVTTKDVSEFGVYVEAESPVALPLYRLVHLQLERDARDHTGVPDALRHGRVLSAVYRLGVPAADGTQGIALRLMVDPRPALGGPVAADASTIAEAARASA